MLFPRARARRALDDFFSVSVKVVNQSREKVFVALTFERDGELVTKGC